MNKIYKLTNEKWSENGWYDKFDAFIVIASSEEGAEAEVIDQHGDWDPQYAWEVRRNYPKVMPEEWHEFREFTKFDIVGQSKLEPQILLSSFNAA